jgi:hypothetical protein
VIGLRVGRVGGKADGRLILISFPVRAVFVSYFISVHFKKQFSQNLRSR